MGQTELRFNGVLRSRQLLATISNSKDTLFEGCARAHTIAMLPPNSGQRL